MGYTHSWYRPWRLDAANFAAWSQDVQTLLQNLPEHSLSAGGYHADDPLTIHGGDGTGEPEITDSCVWLNGDQTLELDHETFFISRVFQKMGDWQEKEADGTWYAFCKTARKPYDLLVAASLIRFKHHFPEARISSDGHAKDWVPGLTLCTNVFGNAQLPFEE